MAKGLIKNIFKLGGVSVSRHNRMLDRYAQLFEKYRSYTMIPEGLFIQNLDLCNAFSHLEGDFVECGVWRGGMSAAIVELLGPQRHAHLFDSFEGLPPAKDIDGKEAIAWQQDTSAPNYYDNCAAEEKFARDAMKAAAHQKYTIYKGWFDQTLKNYNARPIAVLRLDGDWYDSIKVCLDYLFPLVVEGGIVILDDYNTWDGCTRAVHDYLAERKSPSRIHEWNNRIPYIIKKNG